MNAQLKERDIDPPEHIAKEWDDLHREQKIGCLVDAMTHNPKAVRLIEQFYSEALTLGVNPFDYS